MAKTKQVMAKCTVTTVKPRSHQAVIEVRVSERKLQPQATIKFAEKAPKFVANGKHTIVYGK